MRPRSPIFQSGLVAAVLAVMLHVVLWAGVLSGALDGPRQAEFHAAYCGSAPQPHEAPAHPAPCVLCPVCLAHSLPGALPAPAPAPLPARLAGLAPAYDGGLHFPPPALPQGAAYPRGPPLS